MVRITASAVLVCVLAAACTSASHRPAAAPGTTSSAVCHAPHGDGQAGESFTFQGQSRSYQLYVPNGYDGTRPVPLVFDFHGYGSDAAEQMVYGNFKPEADRDDFVIVAPDGQDPAARHFNLTGEPGLQDDVAMVRALLTHLRGELCVDAARVYATGMSDGGAMSSELACAAPDVFAAFAPVALVAYRAGCAPSAAVSIMAFSGTADPVVPFNGGTIRCCGQAQIGAAPAAMAGWAAHDGCAGSVDERLSAQVLRRTWHGCRAGEVVFFIIEGGGHTWPGAIPLPRFGVTTQQVDASSTIWAFFKSHRLG